MTPYRKNSPPGRILIKFEVSQISYHWVDPLIMKSPLPSFSLEEHSTDKKIGKIYSGHFCATYFYTISKTRQNLNLKTFKTFELY